VAKGNGRKRREYRGSRTSLQPKSDCKEPTHARIQTMPRAQQNQGKPRPRYQKTRRRGTQSFFILQLLNSCNS
jgi:hypothetical protein